MTKHKDCNKESKEIGAFEYRPQESVCVCNSMNGRLATTLNQ